MSVHPAIIPCLRYQDAPAAIEFLCAAFGFTRHAVHTDPENASIIHHAQLMREGQMVMLSSATTDSDFTKTAPMISVAQAGGNTHALYIVIDDVDAHATNAREAGADVFREPQGEDYGGRNYCARDPEGYVWSFGSYDPFAG